jgi:hypothetical protein
MKADEYGKRKVGVTMEESIMLCELWQTALANPRCGSFWSPGICGWSRR